MTPSDRFHYIQVFERYIRPGWVVRLIERFEEVYPAAHDACSGFDDPEARDLRPYVLRANVETALVDVTKEFAHHGMVTPAVKNATRSQNHREVVADRVVLTTSAVEYPNEVPRPADFRQQLARTIEVSMFEPPTDEEIQPSEKFYGIVLHGASRLSGKRDYRRLGFVHLAIPNEDCSQYIARFNLAQKYANARVEPEDIAAALARGVPVERTRRPSALLKQYGRRADLDNA